MLDGCSRKTGNQDKHSRQVKPAKITRSGKALCRVAWDINPSNQ